MRLALLLPALAACGGTGAPAASRPPDVLPVVLDTVRADRLGCYGYHRPTSPTMDRLAREGALFRDVTARSSWTRPPMVSLIQGRYVTDCRDVPIEDAPTLAELFAGAGYRTLAFVGNALPSHRAGFHRGWRIYDARRRSSGDAPPVRPGRDLSKLIDAARPHIERVFAPNPDRLPVLLYLHVMDPHDPYEAHPELDGELPREGAAQRRRFEEQRATYAALRGDDPRAAAVWEEMAEKQARYDQEIRAVGDGIGDLLRDLEARGADRILVAVAADHGEGLSERLDPEQPDARRPDHLFFQTHGRFVHEPLLRTPLILWGHGVPAGVAVDAPVENVDLLPTLLELCGLEPPPGLHGRSLVPRVRDPGREGPEAVHAWVLDEASIREVATGLKLVRPREGAPRLYDLRSDPGETRDLAADRPAGVARLSERLDRWRAEHPLETTLGRPRDPQTTADIRAMGYLGGDEGD